jgi:hypothetical protein
MLSKLLFLNQYFFRHFVKIFEDKEKHKRNFFRLGQYLQILARILSPNLESSITLAILLQLLIPDNIQMKEFSTGYFVANAAFIHLF